MNENWKEILGYEGYYQISNFGNIRSLNRFVNGREYKGKTLKPLIGYGGYLSIQLRKNVTKGCFYIHRLVAEHFIPNPENKQFINHKDENKLNPASSNLEWMTQKENHIYSNKGAGFLTRKFSSFQILDIREKHKKGMTIYAISKQLKENGGTISNIVNNKTYKNV